MRMHSHKKLVEVRNKFHFPSCLIARNLSFAILQDLELLANILCFIVIDQTQKWG